MILHKDSHVDHVSPEVVAWVVEAFKARDSFFAETVTLPEAAGSVTCGLYGPEMGDPPVRDDEVTYEPRPGRQYPSRLVARPARKTQVVTVVAGPHDGQPCVLFTVYGGPQAPQEMDDPNLPAASKPYSEAFWNCHALSKV